VPHKNRGGLGRLAAWHLPGGPVGPASKWATTSYIEVGQTIYAVNRGNVVGTENGTGDKVKKRRGKKRVEWGRRAQRSGPLAREGGLYLDICAPPSS